MNESPTPAETEAWLRRASDKGLGSRRVLRLLAIALWASFLGAIPMLLTWLLLLPEDTAVHLGVGELSFGFFLCWLAAMVPTAIALLLSQRGVPRVARAVPEPGHEQQS